MGTTPIYQIPYTEPADDVATYPAQDRAQAEAVEAALATHNTARAERYKNVAQTATAAATYYTITYEIEEQPAIGITYLNGLFTVASAGMYQVNVTQHFQLTGTARLNITKDGTTEIELIAPINNSGSLATSKMCTCNAGSTISIRAQSSVAGGTIYGSSARYSTIDITLTAPAA
jgi:hypothetical protein